MQNGQIVEVDARLMAAAGTLLAKKVELEDDANEEVEGIVVSIGAGTPPSQFDMAVVEREVQPGTPVQVGDRVTVTLRAGANFGVDNIGLTVPSDVSFASANDLLVGQNVQVRRRAGSSGTSIVTDRVRLRSSRFTATVNTKLNATDFTVNNLPGLFANQMPPVNTIEVRTQSQTDFKPAGTSVASLNASDLVSLRGPLFKRIVAGNPVLVAKKVRKR